MAASFDPDALIVTLEAGTTNYDWGTVYKDWKEWLLARPGRRGYPPVFRTTGGDEINALLDQGAYYFFRNDYGWRIRPSEENSTHYPSGNLVPQNSLLPIFTQTLGAYTFALLGLQPVTQGISNDLTDGLQATTYIGKEGVGLYIDQNNATGRAVDSDVFPSANIKNPCLTESNLLALVTELPFRNIYSRSALNLTGDYSSGHVFWGDNPQTININCDTGSDVSSCKFQDCYMTGKLDSGNILWESIAGSITNVNGFIYKCTVIGPLVISENTNIEDCFIANTAPSQECIIDFNNLAKVVIIADWSAGRIRVKNMVAGSFIGMSGTGGRLIIDIANTGGTAVYSGSIGIDDTYAGNIDTLTNSTIASFVWGSVLEGTMTAEEMMRIMMASASGKLSGAATTTINIRDLADAKNRITATVDADGNRSLVVLDGA